MTYSLADLSQEITNLIEGAKADGVKEIVADWIAHGVMKAHPFIEGNDSDFYEVCAYRTVRETTRAVISAYQKGEVPSEHQQILEGYKRAQTHYVVDRGPKKKEKHMVMVHIQSMTYDELTSKAAEHAAMQVAHGEHARELLRFRDDKFSDQSGHAA